MTPDRHPPKLATRFFRFFCHDHFYEELQGDLEETFQSNLEAHGPAYARKVYWKEVVLLLRPSVIKKLDLFAPFKFSPDMIQNYIKIAFRNFSRHKIFSFINVFGLAIGMCVGLFVIAMINDLLQYDQFHSRKQNIYRLISKVQIASYQPRVMATTAMPLAQRLKEDFPGIKEVVRLNRYFGGAAKANDKVLTATGHFADANFFEVFSFSLLEGNPEEALNEPFSIVLTEETAHRFFGNKNPIGKQIEINNYGIFRISGIMADVPVNSHLQFEMLASFSSIPALERQGKMHPTLGDWSDLYSNYAYLLIEENQEPADLQPAINQYAQTEYQRYEDLNVNFELQSLTGIIPGRDLSNQIGPKMPYLPLIIFSLVALMILLSSCFNYTNLSIARSLGRAKEIGIRKTIGAERRQIMIQFLTEAVFIAFLALGLGLLLFEVFKPGFFAIIPRSEQFSLELSLSLLGLFVLFALFSGLLAGFVPAVVLSRLKPALVMKNLISANLFRKITARKALIVFQFVVSMFFIVATAIIWRQYKFALHHDLGFAKENILNVELQQNEPQQFLDEFSALPEVKSIAFSSLVPGTGSTSRIWISREGSTDSISVNYMNIDHNYIPQNEFTLLAGKNFSEDGPRETIFHVIVNEQLLPVYGWNSPEEALDQWIILEGKVAQIIGVVKDFHYTHLEEPITNFMFVYNPEQCQYASLKIASNDLSATLSKLEKTWLTLDASQEFKARFMDEQLAEVYDFFVNIMQLFGFIALLALTISCLGLLGMAIYTTQTRLKEISIRKIFGASASQLLFTLSKGFLILLLIAALIALPASYLLFDQVVLNNFAYRIQIGIFELSSGFILILVLGLITLGSQTIKAVRANPADNLRME